MTVAVRRRKWSRPLLAEILLMRAGPGTEEVAQFVVASAKPVSRSWALKPTHRLISTFDAAVILLQSIVEVAAGAVLHAFTQRRPDRTRITVVAIRGYPVRDNIGDGLGGLEERLGGSARSRASRPVQIETGLVWGRSARSGTGKGTRSEPMRWKPSSRNSQTAGVGLSGRLY